VEGLGSGGVGGGSGGWGRVGSVGWGGSWNGYLVDRSEAAGQIDGQISAEADLPASALVQSQHFLAPGYSVRTHDSNIACAAVLRGMLLLLLLLMALLWALGFRVWT